MSDRVGEVDGVALDNAGNLTEIMPNAEPRDGGVGRQSTAHLGPVLFDQRDVILR